MHRATWTLLSLISVLGVTSISFARGRGSATVTPSGRITVFVYNYAHGPEFSLQKAERMAAGVFRQAGVEVTWRGCQAVSAMGLREASAAPPFEEGSLVLRIVPRFDPATGVAHKEKLGTSFGNMAMVSFQAVQDEAASGDATPEEILGAAIAHELGHLLLGPNSHSERGIMRPHWKREDFERGPHGGLAFTREQTQLIRAVAKTHAAERPPLEAAASGPK